MFLFDLFLFLRGLEKLFLTSNLVPLSPETLILDRSVIVVSVSRPPDHLLRDFHFRSKTDFQEQACVLIGIVPSVRSSAGKLGPGGCGISVKAFAGLHGKRIPQGDGRNKDGWSFDPRLACVLRRGSLRREGNAGRTIGENGGIAEINWQ